MKSGSILAFTDLGCSKGGRQLFKGVHCTVPAGRWLHVAGANGIGKTSLLRMLCGLSPIESGDILWNGQSIRMRRGSFQRDLSYLGHLNGLQESMTVQENLAFATALRGALKTPTRRRAVFTIAFETSASKRSDASRERARALLVHAA